jgi:hypothetical protein
VVALVVMRLSDGLCYWRPHIAARTRVIIDGSLIGMVLFLKLVNHMAPCGPWVMFCGSFVPGLANSVLLPSRVIRPIVLFQ